MAQVARSLLDSNFEETRHSDMCEEVGLDLDTLEAGKAAAKKARDPKFRQAVLLAYEYRCAICGFEGRIGLEAVALDAAHVRWWAVD